MAKHVIFLVHGMGPFTDGWSKTSVQSQISSLYSVYKVSKDLPFDQLFRFEEITYNTLFEDIRKRWKNQNSAVLKQLKKGGIEDGVLAEVTNANAALGADHFLSTHVLDVVLYKTKQVREQIKTHVSTRILDTLLKDPSGDLPRWSIIAHSLGTAVTHDSLHALFTQPIPGSKKKTLHGRTKADVLMMMANVSRVLEEDSIDVYRSATRPGAATDKGVCRFFINAKHTWDPVPRVKEFRPLDDWPDLETRQQKRYVPVEINAIQSKDVHAMSHYLSNPKVHVEFFRRIIPVTDLITDEELTKASAVFEGATPFGQFEALQKELKKLQDPTETGNLGDLIRNASKFFETLKNF
jgi:hypothetical protein